MNEASEKNLKFEDSLLYQNNLDVLTAPFGVHWYSRWTRVTDDIYLKKIFLFILIIFQQ